MPRPLLYRTDQLIYHVTARSNNKEWFYIPTSSVWKHLTASLANSAEKYGTEIHSLALMSNHFHLLVSTPRRNLDDLMRHFLSETTRLIQLQSGRINHVFGGRYKWSVLESASALAYAYKYVYRNPVRAGICSFVEDYKFSTLNTLTSPLCISEGFSNYWGLIPKQRPQKLHWLNLPSKKEQENLIGLALRRYRFQFSTNSNLQKPLRLLKDCYGVELPSLPSDLLVPKVD